MADRAGRVLQDRYRLVKILAEGGMGVVWQGERVGTERAVVVKFLHALLTDRPGMVERFEREARATARLNHPHCVDLVDFGLDEGSPYLVMTYVEGRTLSELLKEGAVEPARAARILRQVLAGLSHAHRRGILHRDLKPANVMILEAEGTTDFVKILDFGLAKLFGGEEQRDVTIAGIAIGTPGYMSPEQAGGLPTDQRGDIYGAGALLYHLVTGVKAFESTNVHATLRKHREDTPVSPLALRPGSLSVELEQVVLRAMRRDPSTRFQTAEEMDQALAATPEVTAGGGRGAAGTRGGESSSSRAGGGTGPTPSAGELPVPRSRGASRAALLLCGLLVGVGLAVGARSWRGRGGAALAPGRSGGASGGQRSVTAAGSRGPETQPSTGASTGLGVGAEGTAPGPSSAVSAADGATGTAGVAALAERPPGEEDPEEGPEGDDGASEDAVAEPAEPAQAPRREMPEVRTVSDVRKLLERGDTDGALAGLYRLRRQKPSPRLEGQLARLIGHLYFERRWWTDALREYRHALAIDRRGRFDAKLIQNAVRALGERSTRARARRLLLDHVGRGAIPTLRRVAKASSSTPSLKLRAQEVLASLQRRGR